MTIANTIKKIEKLTGQKIQTNSNGQYWVIFNGYSISFYPNGRNTPDAEAVCHHTQRVGAEHVTYHDNITQSYNFVARKSAPAPVVTEYPALKIVR